ncbi:hypothetical protein D3C80_1448900 [compost metagenome]
MKRGDIWIVGILIAAVALFAVPSLFGSEEAEAAAYAKISVNGEHYDTVPLSEKGRDIAIRTDRGYNFLHVSEGGIEMLEADCPDKICLTFGHTHRKGDTIVCLPNRIFVEIVGGDGGADIDAVVS